MKLKLKEVRTYIRRMLVEDSAGSQIAALVVGDDSYKSITLYDPQILLKNPKNPEQSIVGYIGLNHHDDCSGAWEVKLSGVKNKGMGALIYGAAFAATGGPIIPDRNKVSGDAKSGWQRQAAKKRGHAPLDNAAAEPEEKFTPDDPSDDCDVHAWDGIKKTGDPYLDQAWQTLPQEIASFKNAVRRHEETMRASGMDPTDLADEIDYAARNTKWIS